MTHGAPGHNSRRMRGRDQHQVHRVATPLELLFDLTFASSFNLAAAHLASVLAEGHFVAGLLAFGFASAAICWAWINFSWFSSAYDTDDWVFRLVTLVQMGGVLVLAIGLPRMFVSIERGDHLDNSVMVLGYVIMRAALVCQWLRAATQDRSRRRACLTYASTVSVAQVGWVMLAVVGLSSLGAILLGAVLVLLEVSGPVLAERLDGGTPWHATHIAERHSLFTIIALGEGIVGAVAALAAVIDEHGWTWDAALVGTASTGLTFGMWWVYFLVPSVQTLEQHRNRAAIWSAAQMLIVTSIVATGAGMHVAAEFIAHAAHISAAATLLTVAIPVVVFLVSVHALYYSGVQRFRTFDASALIGCSAVAMFSAVMAASGIAIATCLLILMCAPALSVVVYEVVGHSSHTTLAETTPD